MNHDKTSRTPILDSSEGSRQANILASEASVQESVNLVERDPFGSIIPVDRSYWLQQDKFKNILQSNAEGITVKSPSDVGFFSGNNYYESIRGDRQSVVGGDEHHYVHGDYTEQIGKQTKKEQKAAKELQKITTAIDKKKVETIKNDEGDDYPCPICSQKVLTERAQNYVNSLFKVIRKYLPNFPFSLDVIQKYINMLVIPFLSTTTNISLNGGEGCGSPGCEKGVIKSAQRGIQKANEEAANELKAQQEKINELQKEMGTGGTVVKSNTGDVQWTIGLEKNNAPTVTESVHTVTHFGFVNGKKPGDPLTADSKGSAKLAVHTDPLINPGSLFIDVANKTTINSGSPGFEIQTSGKTSINGATTTIAATEGELTLMSANRTFLKGKNILIDAKDRSGDSGVRIESDNTMVAGKLSVSGDLALKGSIMMDGGLYCTHLTVPSERIATSPTSDAHQCHCNANWNEPTRLQATLLDQYDKNYKRISRDIAVILTSYVKTPEYVKTLVEETYSTAMLDSIIDGMGSPTGFAPVYNYTTFQPLDVIGVTSDGQAVKGYVVPALIPIYNYHHNHGSPGTGHSHDTSVPAFDGHDNAAASRAARPSPSHVPSTAKPHGMGHGAGPKSLGDTTSCGGGGGAFGSGGSGGKKYKTPKQAIADRNAGYGFSGDPYNKTNYVNTDVPFNPDGTFKNPPQFNMCED